MKRLPLRLIGLLLLFGLLAPLSAQAKGIPFIFNTGDELFEVGALPAEVADDYRASAKLGYRCEHVGLFWADLWTWNCELSVVDIAGKSYGDLPTEVHEKLASQYSMSDAKRGYWNHYGLATIIGIFAALYLWGSIKSKGDEASVASGTAGEK